MSILALFHRSRIPLVQESQVALVQLATKFAEPLPYENSSYTAELEVEAVRHKLQGAEAQLWHLQQTQRELHMSQREPNQELQSQHGLGQQDLHNVQDAGFEEV